MLPVWVIIVILLLILMALGFCVSLYWCHLVRRSRYYSKHRSTCVLSASHSKNIINDQSLRILSETELTVVSTRGESPVDKQRQVGQSCSTLYQSEAPPRYDDIVQFKSNGLSSTLDNHCSGRIRDPESPPPSYQCINDVNE